MLALCYVLLYLAMASLTGFLVSWVREPAEDDDCVVYAILWPLTWAIAVPAVACYGGVALGRWLRKKLT